MENRRLRERIPLDFEIEIQRSNNWVKVEHSKDLSMSGILLQTSEPFEMGESIVIRFCIEGDEVPSLLIPGVVVHIHDHEGLQSIGVRFESLGSDQSIFLYRMIQLHKD